MRITVPAHPTYRGVSIDIDPIGHFTGRREKKKEETYISVVGTGFGDLSKDIVVVVNSTRVDIIALRRSKTFKVFFFFYIHHIGEWGMGKCTADRKTGSRSIRDVAPLITLSLRPSADGWGTQRNR